LPPAVPEANTPPQEGPLHEKPPNGNNEQVVDGLHATEADELELPPRPPAPPLGLFLAYAISSSFRIGAIANTATRARVNPITINIALFWFITIKTWLLYLLPYVTKN
jgi:hypothetical protein